VNGRAVENAVLNAALREGYHTALMKGQYPITFLFVELDPGAVDVNVHPAKREVRFREPSTVREAVVQGVQRTLESDRTDWQQQFQAPAPVAAKTPSAIPAIAAPHPAPRDLPNLETDFALRPQPAVEYSPPARSVISLAGRGGTRDDEEKSHSRPLVPEAHGAAQHRSRQSQQFHIIGVLNKLYVLMENAEGLVLVDQHAAHERILFEEMRRRMEEQGVPSQRLLLPQTFDLAPRDAEWVERNLSVLQKMGIGIEEFGPNTFKIDSLPVFVSAPDAVQFMQAVIDELKSASAGSSPLRLGEDMIAKTVCRHAVKANDPLQQPELEKLIEDLLQCDLPYCCPHGRPTMIQISHLELEKKFGRKV
jgi:DNA mismatch repair protein MutL